MFWHHCGWKVSGFVWNGHQWKGRWSVCIELYPFNLLILCRPDTLTFQALSDDDRKQWMDAMDGREPVYTAPNTSSEDCTYPERTVSLLLCTASYINLLQWFILLHLLLFVASLDDIGFSFIKKCIQGVESRGRGNKPLILLF